MKSDINEHLELLYQIGVECNATKIPELGARRGNSTCALVIEAAETGGQVIRKGDDYACDAPTKFLIETSSVISDELGLEDFWTLVVKDDLDFAKEHHDEIDLFFIDTSHSYEQTKKELEE